MPVQPIPTEQLPNAIGNPAFMPAPGEAPPPLPPPPTGGPPPGAGPGAGTPPGVPLPPPGAAAGPGGPGPVPPPPGTGPAGVERDMRTEVTEADKGPVQELVAKGLQILHSDKLTGKLQKLIQSGEEPVIAAADVLDDVLLLLDKDVAGGIPFAQLVLVAVVLLADLNKILAAITNKPMDKTTLKLALKSSIENVVGKEAVNQIKGASGGPGGPGGVVAKKTTVEGPNATINKTEAAPIPGGALANMA